jgi:hypothetical protein
MIGVRSLALRPLCLAPIPRGTVSARQLSRLAACSAWARVGIFSGSGFKGPGAFGERAFRLRCIVSVWGFLGEVCQCSALYEVCQCSALYEVCQCWALWVFQC